MACASTAGRALLHPIQKIIIGTVGIHKPILITVQDGEGAEEDEAELKDVKKGVLGGPGGALPTLCPTC